MSKKILIITYVVPYPASDGGKISIFGTINYLRHYFDITLVVRVYSDKEKENIETLQKMWPEVSIEKVNYYSQKTKGKIKISLYELAYKVKEQLKKILSFSSSDSIQSGIDFYPFLPADAKFINFLEALFSKKKYDIIQVEYTGLLNLINTLPDNTIKIFVQIENRYTIVQDYFNKINDSSAYAKYIVENIRSSETTLMNKYDYVIALNKNDKKNLGEFLPADKIIVAPFPILNTLTVVDTTTAFSNEKLNKLIFLGSQEHVPNEDAVKWFIENIYEEIYQQYKIKLYVTGKWKKDFIKKYPQVIFTGFVDDISSLIKNSIAISPIRLGGGGVRAKVLQAMAMRVPLVSTTLGCEGIEEIKNNETIYIANNEKEFISSIQNIVENESQTNRVINNAFELIQKHYTERAVGEIRKNIYNSIIGHEIDK
ncbi:MAG TPA: glycosyltransferase family 4 protein [Ferruginibacter sp.]|jgi:glycosyltransferase involved in cell wall biosynthesis|nr:glycosyltransferase family 4 protein [Ferruginibacter sp.]